MIFPWVKYVHGYDKIRHHVRGTILLAHAHKASKSRGLESIKQQQALKNHPNIPVLSILPKAIFRFYSFGQSRKSNGFVNLVKSDFPVYKLRTI